MSILVLSCGGKNSGDTGTGTSGSSSVMSYEGSMTYDADRVTQDPTYKPDDDPGIIVTPAPGSGSDGSGGGSDDDGSGDDGSGGGGGGGQLPTITSSVCSYTIDGVSDINGNSNTGHVLMNVVIDIKLDHLPLNYFNAWENFGWKIAGTNMYSVPIQITAVVQHKGTDQLLPGNLITNNAVGIDWEWNKHNFTTFPATAEATMTMYNSGTRFGHTFKNANQLNLIQGGGGAGGQPALFQQWLWKNQDAKNRQLMEGQYSGYETGSSPFIKELVIRIPVQKDANNNWFYLESAHGQGIKFTNVPANLQLDQSTAASPMTFQPANGCFQGLPPSNPSTENQNFHTRDNLWWTHENFVIPMR